MKQTIGITGASGFMARWVIQRLSRVDDYKIVPLDRAGWNDASILEAFVSQCDVIVHTAGVNRGTDVEVEQVNVQLAEALVSACRTTGSTPHIVFSSTTKRDDDSPYGRGKRRAEKTLHEWARTTEGAITTLVIPNVYGVGCKPFYNSVVATFCHQLTHHQQPRILEDREIELLWVGKLAEEIFSIVKDSKPVEPVTLRVLGQANLKVSELLANLESYRADYFDRNVVPSLTDDLSTSLYATFMSHLDLDDHRHRQPIHRDERGGLCEVIKTDAGGQVFFSTTAPGITRGNHYHTRKIEWFCVVRGQASIRVRPIGTNSVHEYRVSGDSPEFISIPVMHAHSIENTGSDELLTMFWCNEIFDANDADTFFEPVFLHDQKSTPQSAAA